MGKKITTQDIQEFLQDSEQNSELVILEEGKELDELLAVAKARRLNLKKNTDLAVFKNIYAFADKANNNNVRLNKATLLKALPTIIDKPVNIDHERQYVVGHYIDYRYRVKDESVITYGVFYKSNFGKEWEKAKELFKSKKLATSYEIWCPKNKRKKLEDGTEELTEMELAGGAILFKEDPAFEGAKVLELAKRNMEEQPEGLVIANKEKYQNDELILSNFFMEEVRRNAERLAKEKEAKAKQKIEEPIKEEVVEEPKKEETAPELIKEEPKITKEVVLEEAPKEEQPKEEVKETPVVESPKVEAPKVEEPKKEEPKQEIKESETPKEELPEQKEEKPEEKKEVPAVAKCSHCESELINPENLEELTCPKCASIVDKDGKILYPPQIIDFKLLCPSCKANSWFLEKNQDNTSIVKCKACAKRYDVEYKIEENNEVKDTVLKKVNFLYSSFANCPQCNTSVSITGKSTAEKDSVQCPKCQLAFEVKREKLESLKQVSKVKELIELDKEEIKPEKSSIDKDTYKSALENAALHCLKTKKELLKLKEISQKKELVLREGIKKTVSQLISAKAEIKKILEETSKKVEFYRSNAQKILERRQELGQMSETLSDEDILNQDKFVTAKVKKENAFIKANSKGNEVVGDKVTRHSKNWYDDARNKINNIAFGHTKKGE